MKVPTKTAAAESVIRGSRFLSESFSISGQQEVREILRKQKQKYADATHVCHAFVCGKNAEVMGMSDDGEPGGTAGRPMLDVLKGRGVTNVLVTVTRWFGGTLLGTGGLVKAYGDGAKSVLDRTEFEEFVERTEFSISADYQTYSSVKKILEEFGATGLSESFGERIKIEGKIPAAEFARFSETVFDRTSGKVAVSVVE